MASEHAYLRGLVRRLLPGLALLCACLPAMAQEPQEAAFDELPSLLSLEWSAGDDGRSDLYLDLDLAIGGPRLLFSAARSRIDNEFSSYTIESYLVGLSNDPLDRVNYGAELEQWGREDHITATSLRGFLAWNGRDWTATVRPQRRHIVLTTSELCQRFPACPEQWEVESYGIGIDGIYYWQAWGFTAGVSLQDYDRDLSPLANSALVIRLFSPLALELATGFEDYGISAGLRYAFRRALLSVDEYRSVSAVDGLASWLTSARLSIDLDRHWRLRLSAGQLRMPALDDGDTLYGGLGFVYGW